jgi:glycosyltransferase involved in cell wall biosynthesis
MLQQKKSKKLVFTVTNDLNYDQRMIRICSSLQNSGYDVLLVGTKLTKSLPLYSHDFRQKRLLCFFERGKFFYLEYNFRLFLLLLFQKMDLICAIDLDTILPCYIVSAIRRKKRVYDAHELFCEMKEVVTRPNIYKFWKGLEKFAVPKFKFGYTVNNPIQAMLKRDYGVNYEVVMNVPFLQGKIETDKQRFIIYQGAVNQGRSFETLIPAFQWIDCTFLIYGDGNFYNECKQLIEKYGLHEKVILKGKVLPHELKSITPKAIMGITLFENSGLSNYYSLGNRFFDYIQSGVPQVAVNYPAYRKINEEFEVAVLIDDLSPKSIAKAINSLFHDEVLLEKLRKNCLAARRVYNWENEEKKLIKYYNQIFGN